MLEVMQLMKIQSFAVIDIGCSIRNVVLFLKDTTHQDRFRHLFRTAMHRVISKSGLAYDYFGSASPRGLS